MIRLSVLGYNIDIDLPFKTQNLIFVLGASFIFSK
jgi:hypothetical protein